MTPMVDKIHNITYLYTTYTICIPWWCLLYSNFHRWGVILCGFFPFSSLPLNFYFSVVWFLWFLGRKFLYSSNTSFPKLLERRYFIPGPQNGHANFSFVWRPARYMYQCYISIKNIININKKCMIFTLKTY